MCWRQLVGWLEWLSWLAVHAAAGSCGLLARWICTLPSKSPPVLALCLASTGALKVQRDPVQALGLATLLLCFCQADADATLLGRQDVAAGAAQLLKVRRFVGSLAGLGLFSACILFSWSN
jgi:hypothetical protein